MRLSTLKPALHSTNTPIVPHTDIAPLPAINPEADGGRPSRSMRRLSDPKADTPPHTPPPTLMPTKGQLHMSIRAQILRITAGPAPMLPPDAASKPRPTHQHNHQWTQNHRR